MLCHACSARVGVGANVMLDTSVIKGGVAVSESVGKRGTIVGIWVEVAVTGKDGTYPSSVLTQAESKISTAAEIKIRNVFMDKTALK
jgi:hypothetical protein